MMITIIRNLNRNVLILMNLKVTNLSNSHMRSFAATILAVLTLCQACKTGTNKEKPANAVNDYQISSTHFISNKIGWGIKLPGDGWQTILPKTKKGLKTPVKNDLEWALAIEVKDKDLEDVISFRKDSLNSFLSFLNKYKGSNDKEYDLMLTSLHDFFKAGYEEKKIPAGYEMGASRIGGRMIDWFTIKEQAIDASKKKLTVTLYNCMVGQYLLNIVSWSNNQPDKETLEGIIYSSKFSVAE